MGGGVRWRAHGVAGQEKTAVCAGERTDDGAGHSPPRRSGSRFSGGVGSGAHTEARGERTGCQGKKKPVCAGERTDDGAGHSPPRRSGSRFSGDGGAGAGCKKGHGKGYGRRCALASARGVRARKNRCALASARGGGAGILPPRRSGSRFSAGRRGEERARCGPTRLNAIRPALFVRGDSLWIPAATYLPGPSPAKYCRRMRA